MTMMNRNDIDTEVRKTIEVLDNLPRVEAHYLFRARVMERISHEASIHPGRTNTPMRSMKLALMAFLFIINIGSALVLMLSNGSKQTFSKQDTLESLAYEYSSPALSYYLENGSIEE